MRLGLTSFLYEAFSAYFEALDCCWKLLQNFCGTDSKSQFERSRSNLSQKLQAIVVFLQTSFPSARLVVPVCHFQSVDRLHMISVIEAMLMLRMLSSRKFDWLVYIRVCWAVYKNSLMASVSAGWWLDAPFRMRLGGLYSEEHGFKSAFLHCCLRPVTALPWTRGCFPRTLNEVPYSFSSRWCPQ